MGSLSLDVYCGRVLAVYAGLADHGALDRRRHRMVGGSFDAQGLVPFENSRQLTVVKSSCAAFLGSRAIGEEKTKPGVYHICTFPTLTKCARLLSLRVFA